MKYINWFSIGINILFIFIFVIVGQRIIKNTYEKPEINYVKILNHQTTQFIATGYSIGHPYNNITRDGSPVVNTGFLSIGGMQIFTVAVDPDVIPLGSLIYIDSLGIGLCSDTGEKIKGMRLDICFPTMTEAMNWGVRNVNVTLLSRKD